MPEQGREGKTQKPSKRVVRYPDELKQRCMRLLQLRYDRNAGDADQRPISAAVLARALKHWPDAKRETHRRRVRELVQEMREEGAPIASWGRGYSIAREVDDFARTEAFLRRHGIATLATNARLKRSAAHDRAVGQTRLSAYHAAVTGSLAAYLRAAGHPAPTDATSRQGADHQVAAPTTAEQSDQQWSDSLFALA